MISLRVEVSEAFEGLLRSEGRLKMSEIFRRIIEKRGVSEDFLRPQYEALAEIVTELIDVKKAAQRIIEARDKGEKILIYGDYDVDGVTATATIFEMLKMMGASRVEKMLPDRFVDGYGMSKRLVARAKELRVSLVITVDCGSNNAEIIEELSEAGIQTIVTDHHELSSEVPAAAVAVVNPKRPDFRKEILKRQAEAIEGEDALSDGDSARSERVRKLSKVASLCDLSGAGVAFCLAKVLADMGEIPEGQEKWLLDFTVIGTMCDAMRIDGAVNRVLCYYGMIVLGKTRRPGLLALFRAAKIKTVNSEAVGFMIGPRLNAAGRMETAELALELLLTSSKAEAEGLAETLNRLNTERRKQQTEAISEVDARGVTDEPVMVVVGKWHEGVLGIIAGRLMERYKKPCFVLTEVDGPVGNVTTGADRPAESVPTGAENTIELKGSGRSFGEYNLALALSECQDLLISGGGHAAAAGVRLKKENLSEFERRLNNYYRKLKLTDQERFLRREPDIAVLDFSEISLELIGELKQLEPYGEGNLEPVLLFSDMTVLDASKMGTEGQHLRLLLRDGNGRSLKLVAFYADEEWLKIQAGGRVNVAVTLVENEWQGTRSVEGRIVDLWT